MYDWEFLLRFTSGDVGWKTQPAVKEVKAAVREIKKLAKKDTQLAAEGVALFVENISQALSNVDSSAGGIVSAMSKAIDSLVLVFSQAELTNELRQTTLERIYAAFCADQMGLLDPFGPQWGSLCADKEVASHWADKLLAECKLAWGPERGRGYIARGMSICLSALRYAGRSQEVVELLALAPHKSWTYHQFGVRALADQGRIEEALQYAKEAGRHADARVVASLCEEILLQQGMVEQAYSQYGLTANQSNTYQAWYRSVLAKYSHRTAAEILGDLAAQRPGDEGKWFAAAKSEKLYEEAIALVQDSPCSPETLVRAARDYVEKKPEFAVQAGLAALHWLSEGHGYDKTEALVHDAFDYVMAAAKVAKMVGELRSRIEKDVESEVLKDRFVRSILLHKLEEAQ